MKLMIMKRSGRRLMLSDRKAAVYRRMRIAYEDLQPVVKIPVAEAPVPASAQEDEPMKPRGRRRYKRRDLAAEDNSCFEDSNEFSKCSA